MQENLENMLNFWTIFFPALKTNGFSASALTPSLLLTSIGKTVISIYLTDLSAIFYILVSVMSM